MNIDDEKAYIHSYVERISCQIAEHQDEMIMCTIEQIGGAEYRRITIDKNKVLDAFRKATAMRPYVTSLNGTYECPGCRRILTAVYNYCPLCGQKIVRKEDGTE